MTTTLAFPAAEEISRAVQMIHDRPEKIAIAVTGGFAGLQRLLWETPGASRTLLDAAMPYDRVAFDHYVGRPPKKYCSADAAMKLAKAAFIRASVIRDELGDALVPVIGLGATASLATDRVKKGGYRYYVAVYGGKNVRPTVLTVESPDMQALTREEQGRYCDLDALNCLLSFMRLPSLALPSLRTLAGNEWEPWTVRMPDGQRLPLTSIDSTGTLLYPGSFNPLHHGHTESAAAAERQTGKQVVYLIECAHPEKGPLPDEEVARRLRQYEWRSPVIVTRGIGLYVEKAKRFPGFGFIVGADTMSRICDPKYHTPCYWGELSEPLGGPDWFLAEFRDLGTRFYVFDRIDGDRLRTLDDIAMPAWMRLLCTRLDGRWDVSSSELRSKVPPAPRPLPL